jgi:hypothetical protein
MFGAFQSFENMTSIFGEHIKSIILSGSQEKVVRVNAKPNIALVANEKSFWNCTSKKFPGDPMSLMARRMIPSFFVGAKLSIAGSGCGASPEPTSIGFVNFVHESFKDAFVFKRLHKLINNDSSLTKYHDNRGYATFNLKRYGVI